MLALEGFGGLYFVEDPAVALMASGAAARLRGVVIR
jgi:hypothetical protein